MSLFDFLSKKKELAITWPELTERIARIVLKKNGAVFLAAGMWSFIISLSVVTATSAQTKFTGGELVAVTTDKLIMKLHIPAARKTAPFFFKTIRAIRSVSSGQVIANSFFLERKSKSDIVIPW